MKIKDIFSGSLKKKINNILGSGLDRDELLEELEELLVLSDISVDLVQRILSGLEKKIKLSSEKEDIMALLKEELLAVFAGNRNNGSHQNNEKRIIMLVGINGSGKTTSAAKLAQYYSSRGKKVMMSAADTFRAAGSSQLVLWGERLGLPVVGGDRGADPGSVIYNSLNSFQNKNLDLLIVDTAGRVQTRDNLMKELEKLCKIIEKFYPLDAAEILLVVDATMGQNTLDQARRFKAFSGITGLILSKFDGTAKGGTVINIVNEMEIPVRFVGTGETAQDIIPFSETEFIDSLLN